MPHTVTVTATTPTACGCCGDEPPPDECFSCRTKGPTATLCGYPEFVPVDEDDEDDPCNTPGKIYRKMTYNGTLTVCTYDETGCDEELFIRSSIITYSGACEKSAEDCSQVSLASVSRETSFSECGGSGSTEVTDECPGIASDVSCNADVVYSGDCTTKTITGTEECCDFLGSSASWAGEVTVTLSEEDTEDDAIARLLATATWSSWDTACIAGYQIRTGTSFAYTDVEFRIVKTGLTPSTSYDVDVEIWRRSYGVGSYVLYSTITATGTSDGSGNLTITGDVPNDRGYQSEARCDCVATPS